MDNTKRTAGQQTTKNQPNHFAFIIGAMKSGTTSLFEILSQHPQVCPSKVKEPDYFSKDNTENSHDAYLSLWDWQSATHTIALESSVSYTKYPHLTDVPKRIQQAKLGQYRFIYILRDPIKRIESQLRHGLFAGWGKSLDEGIPDDVIHFSSYAKQLDEYLAFFPKENILLITLEEFMSSPHITLTRICRFLQITEDFTFNDVESSRNSGEFFNAPASIARVTQNSLTQFIAHKFLPAKLKTWLRNSIIRLSSNKKTTQNIGRWKLTPEERNHVLSRLADDLKRLESEFGIDVKKYWEIQTDTLSTIRPE